jgi:hypothetical protein
VHTHQRSKFSDKYIQFNDGAIEGDGVGGDVHEKAGNTLYKNKERSRSSCSEMKILLK